MNNTNEKLSKRKFYMAPLSDLLILGAKQSMLSGSRTGQNENTEEEDLF